MQFSITLPGMFSMKLLYTNYVNRAILVRIEFIGPCGKNGHSSDSHLIFNIVTYVGGQCHDEKAWIRVREMGYMQTD